MTLTITLKVISIYQALLISELINNVVYGIEVDTQIKDVLEGVPVLAIAVNSEVQK